MLDHRAPLEQSVFTRNIESIELAGLRVEPVEDRGLLLIQGDPADTLLKDALLQEFELRLPEAGVREIRDDCVLLWLTPKEWLLELPAPRTSPIHKTLATRLAPTLAAVTDVSDAFACFDISGGHAVDVLMTGCSLDLRAFAANQAARTSVADVPAVIWRPRNLPLFRCLIDRSFAGHFWSWLGESPAGW